MVPEMFKSPAQVFSGSQQAVIDEQLRAERNAKDQFREELETLINRHSRENGSNSPDWLLAEYLVDCLDVFDRAVRNRDQQYGIEGIPCNPRISTDEEE